MTIPLCKPGISWEDFVILTIFLTFPTAFGLIAWMMHSMEEGLFSKLGKAKRAYQREVHQRTINLIQLGYAPESAKERAVADMKQEAIAAESVE